MINKNKQWKIVTSCGTFCRNAVKTHYIQVGENLLELIDRYVKPICTPEDIVVISSKIVSLCQRRVIYKKDMKLSRLAKFLSAFASTSDAGIGVNSVWKMQYAIDYCGRLKVIYAAIMGGIGKLFGKRGIFYDIVGMEIRGLDGFYDKSFKDYGGFGILIPEKCNELCNEIYEKYRIAAFISDANDFTRDVLGKADSIHYSDEELCEMIADNPAGQSAQCTPFLIISHEGVCENINIKETT